jgi:hypothetical protein
VAQHQQQRRGHVVFGKLQGWKRGATSTFLHDQTEMKGRCFNCGSRGHVKRECPHKSAVGVTANPTSSTTASDGKKVSKVKATAKSSPAKDSKVSADDVKDAKDSKGKNDCETGGPQQKGETAAAADTTPTETTVEPATDAMAELLREATGLLKSIRGLKA